MAPSQAVYVFDNWGGELRDWNKIVGHYVQIPRLESADLFESGIIVIHWSYFREPFHNFREASDNDDEAQKALIKFANAHRKLIFIVVSGDTQTGGVATPNLCFRKTTVDEPEDPEFAGLFKTFVEATGAGNADFGLLEPAGFPDELVAVYLIALASSANGDPADASFEEPKSWNDTFVRELLRTDAWVEAQKQFRERLSKKGAQQETEERTGSHFASGQWPDAIFESGKPKAGFVVALKSILRIGNIAGTEVS